MQYRERLCSGFKGLSHLREFPRSALPFGEVLLCSSAGTVVKAIREDFAGPYSQLQEIAQRPSLQNNLALRPLFDSPQACKRRVTPCLVPIGRKDPFEKERIDKIVRYREVATRRVLFFGLKFIGQEGSDCTTVNPGARDRNHGDGRSLRALHVTSNGRSY